jgi:CHAD domain-containing protein
MLQDGIYAFYIKHQRKFQVEMKQYVIAPNEESIRQMRVCIKKMRVIFKLLQRLTDSEINAERQLRNFRVTFKSIGNIRDFQLQRHLLADYKPQFQYEFAEYLNYLNAEIYKKSDTFKFNKIDIKAAQLIENELFVKHFILIELQEKEILKRIYTFLKNRFAKIEKLLKKGTEEGLHQIRIWYKEIYYMLFLLNKYHFQLDTFQSKLKEIKKFGRQIGVWHDLTIFRDGFQDYFDKYPTLHYKVEYQILQSKINLDAENKMQELQTQLIAAVLPQLTKMVKFLK